MSDIKKGDWVMVRHNIDNKDKSWVGVCIDDNNSDYLTIKFAGKTHLHSAKGKSKYNDCWNYESTNLIKLTSRPNPKNRVVQKVETKHSIIYNINVTI